MVTFARSICVGLLLGVLFLVPRPVGATIMYDVSFNDQFGTFSAFYAPIQSHLLAAGADWARSIAGDTTLQIEVQFADSINRSFGRSATNAPVASQDGRTVLQEGAAFKIATGRDINGSSPDIIIGFQPTYLQNQLWFDPNPSSRTAPVPSDKTDAMSVVLHELAHAFAFNGFRNKATGELDPGFLSAYDALTRFEGSRLVFIGQRAQDVFGGPVPLTFPPVQDGQALNDYTHLGNLGDPPILTDDLMNGIVFKNGTRYSTTPIGFAVLGDAGVPLVPEPTTLLLFGTTAAGLGLARWRQRRRRASSSAE
jgi:hypothetical protein